jgi:phospholipid transport system transporter-binding protein
VSGEVTVDTAAGLLKALQPHLQNGLTALDFSSVTAIDSAALAVIFNARRQAATHGRTLTLTGLPSNLAPLAELYGVADLLAA